MLLFSSVQVVRVSFTLPIACRLLFNRVCHNSYYSSLENACIEAYHRCFIAPHKYFNGKVKLILEKYYGFTKLNQRPIIKLYTASQHKFPELWVYSGNLGNLHLRKNPLYIFYLRFISIMWGHGFPTVFIVWSKLYLEMFSIKAT